MNPHYEWSLLQAIRLRQSTRRYSDRHVGDDQLQYLLEFASRVRHIHTPGIRVDLVDGQEQAARVLARYAGVYGLVQGAPHLLIGLLPEDTDEARLDLGFVLEQVVVEATRLGLATCWMTGSYHPGLAAREIELQEGEIVAAAVSLGYPRSDQRARLHDGLIRRIVRATRKRPLEEICFEGRWGHGWKPEEADPLLVELLEYARLAPSAHNGQPWRFLVNRDRISLTLISAQPIDAGITMAHVELAAGELDVAGYWEPRLGDPSLGRDLGLPLSVIPVGVFHLRN